MISPQINSNIPLVDLKAQYESIKSEVNFAIEKVLNNCSFIQGKEVIQFEKEFAEYCGRLKDGGLQDLYCATCANGTDALELILMALKIEPPAEIITVSNTFIGTIEPLLNKGIKPVFVDINPKTLLIDETKIEEKITLRTKAIIAVHLYGQPCNMDIINTIAKKHNLLVIEDAAQAHGAYWRNERIGALGDCALFSFFPGKNLGAFGDAGAVVSKNYDLIKKIKILANHGREEKYLHLFSGKNSRLDTLQAAVLRVKLPFLDQWNEKRANLAQFYSENLALLPIILPSIQKFAKSAWHLYVIQLDKRDFLFHELKKRNIESGIHYPLPLHEQPFYKAFRHKKNNLPNTERLARQVLSLPISPDLNFDNAQYICDCIKEIIG